MVALDTVAIPISTIEGAISQDFRSQSAHVGIAYLVLFVSLVLACRFLLTSRLKKIADHFSKAATLKDYTKLEPLPEEGNDENR